MSAVPDDIGTVEAKRAAMTRQQLDALKAAIVTLQELTATINANSAKLRAARKALRDAPRPDMPGVDPREILAAAALLEAENQRNARLLEEASAAVDAMEAQVRKLVVAIGKGRLRSV